MRQNPDDVLRIAILGSTGSIGTQTLDVVSQNPDRYVVEVLTAQRNAPLLIEQALQYQPNVVVIGQDDLYQQVFDALDPKGVKVYSGAAALADVVQMDSVDTVLTALVGYAGLLPTINAIKAGKTIALANKETLVVAGELINGLASRHQVKILPVDSEHSAIFQCLVGEFHNPIEKIILTASGGPFRGKTREFLATATKAQALKHPNWDMGAKVTIDSASLMNKGLEVIEAKWLFDVELSQIDVVVHPQSIIHSMVQFQDGSVKAQMGPPDMRVPIQFALSYPYRFKADFPRMDFTKYPNLTFEQPDTDSFRNLDLAYQAIEGGGNKPCVLNAANEVAVEAFLKERIGFLEMSDLVAHCMDKIAYIAHPSYEDYVDSDKETRQLALDSIR